MRSFCEDTKWHSEPLFKKILRATARLDASCSVFLLNLWSQYENIIDGIQFWKGKDNIVFWCHLVWCHSSVV